MSTIPCSGCQRGELVEQLASMFEVSARLRCLLTDMHCAPRIKHLRVQLAERQPEFDMPPGQAEPCRNAFSAQWLHEDGAQRPRISKSWNGDAFIQEGGGRSKALDPRHPLSPTPARPEAALANDPPTFPRAW